MRYLLLILLLPFVYGLDADYIIGYDYKCVQLDTLSLYIPDFDYHFNCQLSEQNESTIRIQCDPECYIHPDWGMQCGDGDGDGTCESGETCVGFGLYNSYYSTTMVNGHFDWDKSWTSTSTDYGYTHKYYIDPYLAGSVVESGIGSITVTQALCPADQDGDSYADDFDNCINISNDQTDADRDGIGDICDNCNVYNPDQRDMNDNGIGDECDIPVRIYPINESVLSEPFINVTYSTVHNSTCRVNLEHSYFDESNQSMGVNVTGYYGDRSYPVSHVLLGPLASTDISRGEKYLARIFCESDYHVQVYERVYFYIEIHDSDNDSIEDYLDNCPLIANQNQTDSDSDTFGDVCDCNPYNDSVNPDATELFDSVDNDCDTYIDEGFIIADPADLNFSINETYSGIVNLSYESDNVTIVDIMWDADTSYLNLSGFFVEEFIGAILVVGLENPKTVYFETTGTTTSVCVKDAIISNLTDITPNCIGTSEYVVFCDGFDHNGYRCTLDEGWYTVEGLHHSGVVELCTDNDNDGFSVDAVCSAIDCDDSNPDVYPDANELNNDIDDDCDGEVDEGFSSSSSGSKKRGGGSGGGRSYSSCTESWNCTGWSECLMNNSQNRICNDSNDCGTVKSKPITNQDCTYIVPQPVVEDVEPIEDNLKEAEEQIKEFNSYPEPENLTLTENRIANLATGFISLETANDKPSWVLLLSIVSGIAGVYLFFRRQSI